MMVNMEKKAKKIGIGLVTSGIMESIKFGIRKLFRRNHPTEKVPCLVVDKFLFLFQELGKFIYQGYSYNIMSIINSVCSPFGKSPEITKNLNHLREKYGLTVEKEYSNAKEALDYFKKNEEKEWFDKAVRHSYEMLQHYVEFTKPLNELILAHKPETLKKALEAIDRYYIPMKDYFNYLMCEYIQLAVRSKYVYHISHQKLDLLLPDIPSKENLLILSRINQKETVTN